MSLSEAVLEVETGTYIGNACKVIFPGTRVATNQQVAAQLHFEIKSFNVHLECSAFPK